MKTFDFPLQKPVRLTPLTGATDVSVRTTGDFLVTESSTSETPRERAVTLADTGKGVLTRSPKGLNCTVKITLPTHEASELAYISEVHELFRIKDGIIPNPLTL